MWVKNRNKNKNKSANRVSQFKDHDLPDCDRQGAFIVILSDHLKKKTMPRSPLSSKRPAAWSLRPPLASVPKADTCLIHLGFHMGQTRAVQSFQQVPLDRKGCRCKVRDRTKGEGDEKGRVEAPAPGGRLAPLVHAVTRHGANSRRHC